MRASPRFFAIIYLLMGLGFMYIAYMSVEDTVWNIDCSVRFRCSNQNVRAPYTITRATREEIRKTEMASSISVFYLGMKYDLLGW